MTHIAYIVTIPLTAKVHLRGHLEYLQKQGFRITLISSPGADLDEVGTREGIAIIPVQMAREIAPKQDAVSFLHLCSVLRDIKPDVVNAGTPKAGFIGMMAARYCGVPLRIYTLHGNRAETLRGNKRKIVLMTERLTSSVAHRIVCVSKSLGATYSDAGLAPVEKITVLANGSANGLDVSRFKLNDQRRNDLVTLRQSLELSDQDRVIGFVGRFTRDKGIVDLVSAWQRIKDDIPRLKMLLLGRFEEGDPIPAETVDFMKSNPDFILPGFIQDTSLYYHLMDVLALPSYREGFPVVPLEAAAAGVPTIGYAATGIVDAIVDEQTGLLAAVGDTSSLADRLTRVFTDDELRRRLGQAAYDRVISLYQPEVIWSAWASFYNKALGQVSQEMAMPR